MMRLLIGIAIATLALSEPISAAPTKQPRPAVIVDAEGNVRNFYGVPITLTKAGLKGLPFAVKQGRYSAEGDEYTNYTITALKGVQVIVEFSDDGTLHGADTVTAGAVGTKGIGVGSTLADVRRAWPKGMFIYGFADGYYVTYITGTNVLLRFNPKDMPRGAFDHEAPFDLPVRDTIKVQKISVYPKPNPVPKGIAPPDPNRNSSTATSEGKSIWTFEVERIAGSSVVHIRWTDHRENSRIDHQIDISQFPDFDIWTRDVIQSSRPIVLSFRYGDFKDCSAPDDDRALAYVTLDSKQATPLSAPPAGVKIWPDYGRPKYVGKSMKSAAGCRRTYDPVTGKFGLERVQ